MIATRVPTVVPSLLAADVSRLGEKLDALKKAGCKWISVDVMDGHFVPNLSFGPEFARLCKIKGFYVDAHLMVTDPVRVAQWYKDAGADLVTVHLEATIEPKGALKAIKAMGCKVGLAVKPKTPVYGIIGALEHCDLALVMTVEPGFGGQAFMPEMLPKVAALRAEIDARKLDCWLQVDGGVNAINIAHCAAAGADSLVAGSAVFGVKDPGAAYRELEQKARAAFGTKNA